MTQKIDITEQIKSFEDAMVVTGRPDVPDLSNFPEDMREYFAAHYRLSVIAEALNEGWQVDYSDDDQEKYYPWFYNAPGASSFVFCATHCVRLGAIAGHASRLCFETDAKAEYAGRQFIDVWNVILKK